MYRKPELFPTILFRQAGSHRYDRVWGGEVFMLFAIKKGSLVIRRSLSRRKW